MAIKQRCWINGVFQFDGVRIFGGQRWASGSDPSDVDFTGQWWDSFGLLPTRDLIFGSWKDGLDSGFEVG